MPALYAALWNNVLPHIRRLDFALDTTGWDSTVIDAPSSTLTDHADVFSLKVGYGIVPYAQSKSKPLREHTDCTQSSYIAASLIQRTISPRSSPSFAFRRNRTTSAYSHRDTTDFNFRCRRSARHPRRWLCFFSLLDFFSGLNQLTIHPKLIPLTAFCTPSDLHEWLRIP